MIKESCGWTYLSQDDSISEFTDIFCEIELVKDSTTADILHDFVIEERVKSDA